MAATGTNERVTQSFVGTLLWCWRRPSLTALEVLWRWVYGIPVLLLLRYEAERILLAAPLDYAGLRQITLLDPARSLLTLGRAWASILPLVHHVVIWMAPLLILSWGLVSAVGRSAMLKLVDARLHARVGALFWLHLLRAASVFLSLFLWSMGLWWAAYHLLQPAADGKETSPVLFLAVAIVLSLAMFVLSIVSSWDYTLAPLIAMSRSWGAWHSLREVYRIQPLKRKLIEINLVMGIVKIALIVLAMVFSASPLPFETVASPEFLTWWWAGVAVLYLVASDFFHVARLVAYLELWRADTAS